MAKPQAGPFLRAFLDGYDSNRGLADEETWRRIWTTTGGWNALMLGNPVSVKVPWQKSVLLLTAEAMGLRVWPREVLTIDSVFHDDDYIVCGTQPLPFLVAVEHENAAAGFGHEVAKLLSVRCRLKVGITYRLLNGPNFIAAHRDEFLETIRGYIIDHFGRVWRVSPEDPSTEYLFIVGVEESPFSLVWYCTHFSARHGPRAARFRMHDRGPIRPE